MTVIDARPYQFVLSKLVEDGATDRDIARRIGYSKTAVRNIRIGRAKTIYPQTAAAIANLLKGVVA
jgi:transcriptional regulator with XRE-family HTH domain